MPDFQFIKRLFASEPPSINGQSPPKNLRFVFLGIYIFILSIAFSGALLNLLRLSLDSSLFSHIPLIPVIAGYLIWIKRADIPAGPIAFSPWALLPIAVGVSIASLAHFNPGISGIDLLALKITVFYCFLVAGAFLFLGWEALKTVLFAVAFLVFIIPFPQFLNDGIETFFQHTSAWATQVMFTLSQTTYFREGLVFQLPGTVIQVAQECSGIRSSLVLFITALLAGQLFLKSPWKKAFLVLFVIPLGIARNGFRIWTISLLCIHVSPEMIHSPIHHQGGPIFFLLSLIPFFLLLLWLRKTESDSFRFWPFFKEKK